MTRRSDATCDYCGLPLSQPLWKREASQRDAGPGYCCFGCRFAASVTGAGGNEAEARWMLTRLGLAIFLSMNVMVFTLVLWSYDAYAIDATAPMPQALAGLLRSLCLLLSLPVLFMLGGPILGAALADFRRGIASTDLLILAGVMAAYAYSLVSVMRGAGPTYFEVACMVLVFIVLGRWLEATGKLTAAIALDELERLLPARVTIATADGTQEIALADLGVGQTLVVRPHERFSTDGVLLTGPHVIDEQVLTGEGWPRTRLAGEPAIGGALNLETEARVHVTARPDEGTLARMVEALRTAREAQGQYQRLADRAAGWFLWLVSGVSLVTLIVHGVRSGWGAGLMAALSVLLVACPCALGLATPLAIWSGLSVAARRRVIFRSGEALERLADVKAIRFDKTGTLTTGRARILAVHSIGCTDDSEIWQRAAQLAAGSRHVFCQAIQSGLAFPAGSPDILDRREQPGLGVSGRWAIPATDGGTTQGTRAALGNERLMTLAGLTIPDRLRAVLDQEETAGHPLTLIGWDGLVRGVLVFSETIRPEAAAALERCREQGLDIAILTGDHPSRGDQIARELRVPVSAGLLPDQKIAHVEQARGFGPVAMVGDGINDAGALTLADVGIAMGCGTDIARDSADVCLLGDDLTQIPWAVGLAQRTVKTIRQNLAWAFGYNLVGVLVATTGTLHPALAAGLMLMSSVIVIANSLRLNRYDQRDAPSATATSLSDEMNSGPPAEMTKARALPATTREGGRAVIELPLVFLGGFLGSSHCVGMCGGFALMIGVEQPSSQRNLQVQLVYSFGRISTYVFLGALAGWLAQRLTLNTQLMQTLPAALCLLAGLFLIIEGLKAAGIRLWGTKPVAAGGCLFSSHFASLLRGGRFENAFAAGILTGFLPCGLVYAFLSLAASTGSIGRGAAVMGLFGLGTVPLMVVTGLGASLLSLVARRRLLQWAAWCVVLTGVVTVARGAAFLRYDADRPASGCPLCPDVPEPQ